MQLTPLNPLAYIAAVHGMTRPLDRNDFKGGHIPDGFMSQSPYPGFLKGLRWGGADPYRALASSVGLVTGDDASGQDTWNTNVITTTQRHPLGAIGIAVDGRVFRYASAGAADLVIGNIVQSAAPIPLHLALTSAAQAIGDGFPTPIVVTPGATAGAANLYAEGTLAIDTTPGNGYNYRISGHPAITASVAFNLFLTPDDRIQLALTTASRYGLHHNPYKTVIQTPTTATALVVGGVVTIITANTLAENFGWLQTRGPFAALINGTPAVTSPVANSGTTAGAVDVWTTAAAAVVVTPVGRMMQVGVSGKNNSIFLTLD